MVRFHPVPHMKNISDYIKENTIKYTNYLGDCTFDEFMHINNFNENTITEDVVSQFYLFNFNDFVERSFSGHRFGLFEALKSYSAKQLIKSINNKFPELKCAIVFNGEKGIVSSIEIQIDGENLFVDDNLLDSDRLKDNKDAEKLLEIIKFNGYNITQITKYLNTYIIIVEPRYQEDIKDSLDSLIFYHVTKRSNVDNIMKTGLRPRQGYTLDKKYKRTKHQVVYRTFDDRVFLINDISDKDKLIDNIKSVIRDKKYSNDEYAIIKCDLRGYKNISIYIDTMSNGINNMYTVYPISPKCLTVYYNIEDIL